MIDLLLFCHPPVFAAVRELSAPIGLLSQAGLFFMTLQSDSHIPMDGRLHAERVAIFIPALAALDVVRWACQE
jgi:hypothetical protein